jgi:asparagine synthase (glutamine-hydrolysing)
MCGIAGVVSLDGRPIDPDWIKRMCDAIAHRGPDDAGYAFFRLGEGRRGEGGYWCSFADAQFRHVNEHLPLLGGSYCREELAKSSFSVALGHRRLAIIDLTPYGHQPMSSSDCRYWITYNGEIYNFPELREDLRARGHVFRTRSDTEVLLHLWEEHGRDCLTMLDGMFAFALYDRVANVITLARDRFGVKPLYYATADGYVVFASEIKGILASGLLRPSIHPAAVTEYFTFQNLFSPQTLFRNVLLLGPGERLEFSPGSPAEPTHGRYHAGFPLPDPSITDEAEAAEMVADAFSQAIRRQLVSDVEVGSYLSGGMDSGSIVAVAGRTIPRLLTFTAGFDLTNVSGIEQGFDERKLAEKLAYLLQTEHYDVVLHAGDMPAAMDKISWHMDDPRVGMCHQNWYAARLASRFVKVCLAGTGGDELFGGYPWRYRQGLAAGSVEEFDRRYFDYWHRLLGREELSQLFVPELGRLEQTVRESFDRVWDGAPPWQPEAAPADNLLQRALHFEFKTFLQGLLITDDHVSMAHGLETRVPFLDNRLADLAFRLPASMKVNTARLAGNSQGPLESVDGKRILRRAMGRYLPEEFTQQPKQGFSPPDENWYRGPSMDYIRSILLDKPTADRPWFDQRFVRAKLAEHFEGKRNHRLLIWSLLSFELIQRHFIDRPAAGNGGAACLC